MTNTTTALEPILLWSTLEITDHIDHADWAARTRGNAVKVLSAPVGTEVVHMGVPSTVVASRSWDGAEGRDRLAREVVVSSDGYGIESGWCRCVAVSEDDWTYYERWTIRGCEVHGWACPDCRGIVQVG